jgi:hypothetical protein
LSTTDPSITIWRTGTATGNHSTDPLQLAGKLVFKFPTDFLHTTYALAVRVSLLDPGAVELYFGVGSELNAPSTDPALSVGLQSGDPNTDFVGGAMPPDSIQRVLLRQRGGTLQVSDLTTIATGLRNAAGMVFGASGDLIFQDNGIDGEAEGGVLGTIKSADELNILKGEELGLTIPDFGFSEAYTAYELDGNGRPVRVGQSNPAYRVPVVEFSRQPDGSKNEGAVEIAEAPIGFDGSYLNTVFTAFFGGYGASNDENPVVAGDLITGQTFHWISPQVLWNPMGLLAVPNALYLADSYFSSSQLGVVYRFTPKTPSAFTSPPVTTMLVSDGADLHWTTSAGAITGVELSGGMVNGRLGGPTSPRQVRIAPSALSSGDPAGSFRADVHLTGLDAFTTYTYLVRVAEESQQGSFRTQPQAAPAVKANQLLGVDRVATSYGMLAGPDGSIYLTINFSSQDSLASDADAEIRKIDANGQTLWAHSLSAGGQDLIYDVVAGPDDSLYVGGRQRGVGGHQAAEC